MYAKQMEVNIENKKLVLKVGDITEEETEAIVNAANPTLLGGGGVDGAIHKKGGSKILEECKKIRREQYPDRLPFGEAVITSAGNLKAKYVIHTVGPICESYKLDSEKEKLLSNAYRNSLLLADSYKIKTVAFPSISTGAYRCPLDSSSKVALKTVLDLLPKLIYVEKVVFILFKENIYKVYKENLEKLLTESK